MARLAVLGCLLVQVWVAAGQGGCTTQAIAACTDLAAGAVCGFSPDGTRTVCGQCGTGRQCGLHCRRLPGNTDCVTTTPAGTPAPATPVSQTAVPTSAPATDAPVTPVPATPIPPTAVPTPAPATGVPATPVPLTPSPPTAVPTPAPATGVPATPVPATPIPPTDAPATPVPTAVPTQAPATDAPPATPTPGTPIEESQITCTQQATNGNAIVQPCEDTHIVPVASAPAFAHPTTLTSTNGLLEATLTVEQYQVDAGAFRMNVRAYCYEGACSVPGPMFKVYPGDTVRVTLVNNLLDVAPEAETSDGEGLNAFREANITNMHTHGLHVDPSEDNVVVGVLPGASKTYTYVIPRNHLPGTHWYHSHHHGSSSLQVMGGLVGMFVIDVPDFAESPQTDIQTFATESAREQWSQMPVSHMTLTHLSLCSCNPTTAGFRIRSYSVLRELTGDNIPLGAELIPNTDGSQTTDVLLVNGQRQPVREMRQNVWNRFEMVNAVGDVYLEIEVRTGVAFGGGGATACRMRLMSLDGVFLHSGARDETHVLLAPASRAGVAVMCDTPGTYYLQSNPTERASAYDVGFLQNLMTLSVSAAGGDAGTTAEPVLAESDVTRPNYLQNLLEVESVATEWQVATAQGRVVGGGNWLGVGTDCANTNSDCPQLAFGFPESETAGRKLENFPYRHVGRLCDIEDVVVNGGGATPHPIHFHVNHFQIVSFSGNAATLANWGQVGDWRDTIPALGGALRIRHEMDEHGANIMVHCHFLPHEDQGMMDRYWVVGLESDGTAPVPPCSATGTDTYCDSSVPSEAFDNAYPQVSGTCTAYRTSADDVIPVPPPQ